MSPIHLHHLRGCAPTPLAHYLKALGILRLVSEQKDPGARGFWKDEHFCLLTTLDREGIERFFLEEYAPSPFVSPWNKGSGFYAGSDKGLSPIESSTAPRLAPFREGVASARAQLAELSAADTAVRTLKERTKSKKGMTAGAVSSARDLKKDPAYKKELAAAERRFKELKADLFAPALRTWRGAHRAWMDAAVVAMEGGEIRFPSLLGTGGNDGRLDFTNNAMQRLGDLIDLGTPEAGPRPAATRALVEALWSAPTTGLVNGAAVGQFLPGAAGGANMTTGPDAGAAVNAWDFVLMLEGTLCLSARTTRRLDPRALQDASAPFAIRSQGAGVATAGKEKDARGEQWMPLWTSPAALRDLDALLGEARLQLGRTTAHRPIDAARAIARLGVARGISSFVRYGYLERNGQSNIAVPLGRIDVRERPYARLVDDLAAWLDRLRRLSRDKNAPARLVHAERRLADAVFDALTHDASPDRWQAILRAAVAVEEIQATGTAFAAGPIPPLSPGWLDAADDGSPEWRLACALGGARGRAIAGRPIDSARAHWLPLEKGERRFRTSDRRLVRDPRVVALGRDAVQDLAAVIERRLVESAQAGRRRLPLVAAPGFSARLADLAQAAAGELDLERTVSLARALMAVSWKDVRTRPSRASSALVQPAEAWTAIRLALLPWPLDEARSVAADEAIVRRLVAGDGAGAVEVALRRLGAAGLRPPLRGAALDPARARLWAATLAFPITRAAARRLARPFEQQND